MTNKLVVIINSLKVPKIKKILLYEISRTKLLLPPEPLAKGLPPPDPRSLCRLSSTEFVELPPPRTKFLGKPLCCCLFVWGDGRVNVRHSPILDL